MFAPGGTPRAVVEQISGEVARIIQLPDVAKQMANQGEQGRSSTPDEFAKFVRAEVEKYRRLVKLANIRVE
jgi:tripartite-type tricarboxylate transporter receptor subunit TctC